MTGPAVVPDVDTTVLDALDFDVVCIVMPVPMVLGVMLRKPKQCENPATYIMRCRACQAVAYCCTKHALEVQSEKQAVCGKCDKAGLGLVVFELSPMGRS